MVLSGRKQGSFLEGKRFLLCLQQKWFWGAWQCVTSRGEGLSEPGGDFPSFAQALSVTCLCIRRKYQSDNFAFVFNDLPPTGPQSITFPPAKYHARFW
jgi:hypothetical protein